MYNIIKDFINFIFIFSTINDNYLCDITHNDEVLKIIMVLFMVVNYKSFLTTDYTKKKYMPFLLFLGVMLISTIINYPFYKDLFKPLFLIISTFSIFVVFSSIDKPQKIIWFYVLSVIFSACICIFTDETITQWDFRKTGGTGDPNEFSTYVLSSIGFLLGTLLNKSRSLFFKIIYIFCIFVLLLSLIYAGSKSAILTLLLLLLFYVYLVVFVFKSRYKFFVIAAIALIFVVGVNILLFYYSDSIYLVVERFSDNHTANTRFASWGGGWEMFKINPIFGVGYINYIDAMTFHNIDIGINHRAAHNMYVQCLAELGMLGILSFLWLLFKPIQYYFQYKNLSSELFLTYIPILIMGMTLSHLAEKYVWIIFALMYNRYLWLGSTKTPKREVY